MHLSNTQKKLVHKVRMAVDAGNKGEDFKTLIDEREVFEAMKLLLIVQEYNRYHKRNPQ